jgi:hypothetical protein
MFQGKLILDADKVKIFQDDKGFNAYVQLGKSDNWLKFVTYPNDIKGLVASLGLSIDIFTGKFYPDKVIEFSNAVESPLNVIKFKQD